MKRTYINPQTFVYATETANSLAASAYGGTPDPFGRDAGDGGMFPGGLDINPDLPW